MDARDSKATHGLEELALETSCKASTDAAPRQNLPIPRELRDQIYDYVLASEWVEEPAQAMCNHTTSSRVSIEQQSRVMSFAPTYKFNLTVLILNREIRDEALSRLPRNSFIVVSHVYPELSLHKPIFDLPIVTERKKQLALFPHYDMRVHIQAPNDVLAMHGKRSMRTFMVLAKHLPLLCQLLQWLYYAEIPGSPLIVRKHNMLAYESYELSAITTGEFQTKIKFNLKAKQRLGIERMMQLLKPFNDMIIANQSVTLCDNHSPILEIDELKHGMGPAAIWPKAMAWHIFEAIQALLRDAEKSIDSGIVFNAYRKYRTIANLYSFCRLFHLPTVDNHGTHIDYSDDTLFPVGLIARTMLDAIASLKLLSMRLSVAPPRHNYVGKAFAGLQKLIQSLPGSIKQQIAPFHHKGVLHLGCAGFNPLQLFFSTRTEATLFEAMGLFDELYSLDPSNELIAFDRKVVRQTFQDPSRWAHYLGLTAGSVDAGSITEALIEQSSVLQLPIKVLKPKLWVDVSKPDGLDGFVDMAHLDNIRANDSKFRVPKLSNR